jgi:phosphoribosylanthranilate isomerase
VVKVKICGLMQIEDAVGTAQAGADFVGLVFAPSKRQVGLEQAKRLSFAVRSLPNPPLLTGVFAGLTSEEVNRIAEQSQLDYVQLSGDECWEYCADIYLPVIKTVHIAAGTGSSEILDQITLGCEKLAKKPLILLDAWVPGNFGGTGKSFDWTLVKELARVYPVIIAGGLDPGNVARLVDSVNPWGVDASSGVETSGVKDMLKIKKFITAAKAAGGGNIVTG